MICEQFRMSKHDIPFDRFDLRTKLEPKWLRYAAFVIVRRTPYFSKYDKSLQYFPVYLLYTEIDYYVFYHTVTLEQYGDLSFSQKVD